MNYEFTFDDCNVKLLIQGAKNIIQAINFAFQLRPQFRIRNIQYIDPMDTRITHPNPNTYIFDARFDHGDSIGTFAAADAEFKRLGELSEGHMMLFEWWNDQVVLEIESDYSTGRSFNFLGDEINCNFGVSSVIIGNKEYCSTDKHKIERILFYHQLSDFNTAIISKAIGVLSKLYRRAIASELEEDYDESTRHSNDMYLLMVEIYPKQIADMEQWTLKATQLEILNRYVEIIAPTVGCYFEFLKTYKDGREFDDPQGLLAACELHSVVGVECKKLIDAALYCENQCLDTTASPVNWDAILRQMKVWMYG